MVKVHAGCARVLPDCGDGSSFERFVRAVYQQGGVLIALAPDYVIFSWPGYAAFKMVRGES
jgi:hypothetical protein